MGTISGLKTTFLGVGAAVIFAGGITTGSTAIPAEDEPPDIEPSVNEETHNIKKAIAEEQYDERVSKALRKKSKALDKADRKIRELRQKLEQTYVPQTLYRSSPESVSGGSAQAIAKRLLAARGWSGQWSCLNSLIMRESGWDVNATNPSSGAYGIPQALPGSKMASAGSDWRTNAATQLRWMMGYVANRYGTPCGAWGHSQATGWY